MMKLFNVEAFSLRVKSAVIAIGGYRKASVASEVPVGSLHEIAAGGAPSIENYHRIYKWLKGDAPPLP